MTGLFNKGINLKCQKYGISVKIRMIGSTDKWQETVLSQMWTYLQEGLRESDPEISYKEDSLFKQN